MIARKIAHFLFSLKYFNIVHVHKQNILLHFLPLLRFPFQYRNSESMCPKPHFCPPYQLQCFFRFGGKFQLRLALLLLYPYLCIHRVGVYYLVLDTLLLHQGKCVHYGKKLPYVVGALYRTEVEYLCTRLQIDTLILHRSRVA